MSELFECRYCDAAFGIAGEVVTDDDRDAQDYYDEQVRFHANRLCRHRSTPQSVLDAPRLRPVQVWPEPRHYGPFDSTAFGPYRSPKVRKVRRGRKARWNR
jgi:hypothetical protein